MTEQIKDSMSVHIPEHTKRYRRSAHPWIKEPEREAVRRKHNCVSDEQARAGAARKCSGILYDSFARYLKKMRTRIRKVKRGSKVWWKLARQVSGHATSSSTIPAARSPQGDIVRDPALKVSLFAIAFLLVGLSAVCRSVCLQMLLKTDTLCHRRKLTSTRICPLFLM